MTSASLAVYVAMAAATIITNPTNAQDPAPGDGCVRNKEGDNTKTVKVKTSEGIEVQLDMWCFRKVGPRKSTWKVEACSYPAGSDPKKNPSNFWKWDHKKGISFSGKTVYLLCNLNELPTVTERDPPKIGGDCDADIDVKPRSIKFEVVKTAVLLRADYECSQDLEAGVWKWRVTSCCDAETGDDNCKLPASLQPLTVERGGQRVRFNCDADKTPSIKDIAPLDNNKTKKTSSGSTSGDSKPSFADIGNLALIPFPD